MEPKEAYAPSSASWVQMACGLQQSYASWKNAPVCILSFKALPRSFYFNTLPWTVPGWVNPLSVAFFSFLTSLKIFLKGKVTMQLPLFQSLCGFCLHRAPLKHALLREGFPSCWTAFLGGLSQSADGTRSNDTKTRLKAYHATCQRALHCSIYLYKKSNIRLLFQR